MRSTESDDNSQGKSEISENQDFNCKHEDTMWGSVKFFYNYN